MLDLILNVDGEEGQSIPLIVDSPHSGIIYPVSYTHLRAHETRHDLVCRLLLVLILKIQLDD